MLKTTSRIAGIFMAAVICPVTMAAVILENTFESSTEGWSAITTAVGNPSTPVSFASLGNPGGALKHVAPSDNLVSYFISPSSAAIALHSAVGGVRIVGNFDCERWRRRHVLQWRRCRGQGYRAARAKEIGVIDHAVASLSHV